MAGVAPPAVPRLSLEGCGTTIHLDYVVSITRLQIAGEVHGGGVPVAPPVLTWLPFSSLV